MNFNDIEELKQAGFVGFEKMNNLFMDSSILPKVRGIYMVIRAEEEKADFLATGTGGYFKGKNPNISINELKSNWVENTIIVYIGKAGKEGSKATLQSRLRQYFGFGQGGNVGHWGGRLIWQLKNRQDLIVCWKPLANEDPRAVEADIIQQFKSRFSKRPFANLVD